jgi:hypothetical protein
MALTVVEDAGRGTPVVLCDRCQERIVDALEGVFSWGRPSVGDGRIVFAHEGACAEELEALYGRTTWEVLAKLPIILGVSLGMRRSGAWQAAWRSAAPELGLDGAAPWDR